MAICDPRPDLSRFVVMKRRIPDELRAAGSEVRAAGADLRSAGAEVKAAGAEMVAARVAAGAEAIAKVKPKLRGYVHQYAFFVALALGVALVLLANGAKAKVAALVYALSLAGLLGTSALYHRVNWSAVARRRMRRLDHSMIFVLIAGTVTPIALLAVEGTLGVVLLSIVWGVALGGIVMKLLWIDSPKWVSALIYSAAGLIGTIAIGSLLGTVGVVAVCMIGLGGACYIAGGTIYALGRPDPLPATFGYHEVFHVLVVVAAALHFTAIAGWVVPLGA